MKYPSLKYLIFKAFIMLMLCVLLSYHLAEASVTLAWQPPAKNTDGTLCSDLAGYKIYYDTDRAGAPYTGRGIREGGSPITVPLSSLSNTANPEFVLSGLTEDVTYHISVTAYDNSLNESRHSNNLTALVSSTNTQPVADAGSDQVITQTDLSKGSVQVTLNGSASHDGDGDSLTYSWLQTRGSPVNLMGSSSKTPFFSATSALMGQTLTFQLVVNDGKLDSQPDSVSVLVQDGASAKNAAPVARIGATPTQGTAPLSVSFSGTGTDTDGSIIKYRWSHGDGSSTSTRNHSHTYTSPGTYTVTLTVTDNDGATGTDSLQIVVSKPSAANTPPSLSISADPLRGAAPLSVNFSSSAKDSDGNIRTYLWDFGDHAHSRDSNPSHIYDEGGTYQASLTVIDNDGARTRAALTIHVTAPPIDQDSDEDGVTDKTELETGLNPNSGDSDGDGISDFIEWGPGATPMDSDGDGIIDALDTDSDNDGKADRQEGIGDDDGDGVANYMDSVDNASPLADQDQDGVSNSNEVTYMMNPDQKDSDGDGISDGVEFGPFPWPLDSDGDGIKDVLDEDSDNDGKSDREEGTGDNDHDGALNYIDINDSDGRDSDQDQDGLSNEEETRNGMNPNLPDSDLDGIPDSEEVGDKTAPFDTDADGVIDAQDTDSDDDGISDEEESREDMDGNNIPDRLDVRIAAFVGKQGIMAIKLVTEGCRLAETKYVPDALPIRRWDPFVHLKYGGLQFTVKDVEVGGTVDIQIISKKDFSIFSQYWKFDRKNGYERINSKVRGKILSYAVTDGARGDSDYTADGSIDDPGFIGETEAAVVSEPSPVSSGGGGSGCSVNKNSSGFPDGLLILTPMIILLILKRLKKARIPS